MRRYALVSGGDDRHRGKTSPSVRAGGQCLPGEQPSLQGQSYALKPQFARIFLPETYYDFFLMTVVITSRIGTIRPPRNSPLPACRERRSGCHFCAAFDGKMGIERREKSLPDGWPV